MVLLLPPLLPPLLLPPLLLPPLLLPPLLPPPPPLLLRLRFPTHTTCRYADTRVVGPSGQYIF